MDYTRSYLVVLSFAFTLTIIFPTPCLAVSGDEELSEIFPISSEAETDIKPINIDRKIRSVATNEETTNITSNTDDEIDITSDTDDEIGHTETSITLETKASTIDPITKPIIFKSSTSKTQTTTKTTSITESPATTDTPTTTEEPKITEKSTTKLITTEKAITVNARTTTEKVTTTNEITTTEKQSTTDTTTTTEKPTTTGKVTTTNAITTTENPTSKEASNTKTPIIVITNSKKTRMSSTTSQSPDNPVTFHGTTQSPSRSSTAIGVKHDMDGATRNVLIAFAAMASIAAAVFLAWYCARKTNTKQGRHILVSADDDLLDYQPGINTTVMDPLSNSETSTSFIDLPTRYDELLYDEIDEEEDSSQTQLTTFTGVRLAH